MSKQTEYGNNARKKLLKGAKKLANAVVPTLGPFGRNAIFEVNGSLQSTKDGVTVAKNFSLEDPIENMGCEIVKQAAIKSASQVGDGTTTTTLLAYSFIKEGLAKVDKGANATEIKKQIENAIGEVIGELKKMSQNITSPDELRQIATISSNNDEKTGELIATALEKVGKDGVVSIEESKTGETKLDTVEGMQFDRGYLSPFFVTNNNTMQAVLDNPYILMYDGNINAAKDIVKILENISAEDKPILVIAEDVNGEALSTLLVNKLRGIIKACAVKSPDFGERRTLLMEDLAVLTGGTFISKNKGQKIDNITTSLLGTAAKVVITKDKTTIIDGKGNQEDIVKRAQEIKDQLDKATSNYEKEKLQERLAKLTSGVAIIYVGGSNDIEIKEYKDRVEDALFATKAAVEEGFLPGGGVALFHAREVLKNSPMNPGKDIVYNALSKPFTQILSNSGIEDTSIYTSKLKELIDEEKLEYTGKSEWIKNEVKENIILEYGWKSYDLKSESWIDFKEKGIIDPTKVVRIALENASSVASTILITETVIFNKLEEKKEQEQLY